MLTFNPVIGTLKGYDQLMNLVLDEVKEALTGMLTPQLHTSNLLILLRR
jgi:small nuclear ribonucleoprotein (snRNP)-like protein